ncbi:PE family protein, partial [Streptomyces sp. me109]
MVALGVGCGAGAAGGCDVTGSVGMPVVSGASPTGVSARPVGRAPPGTAAEGAVTPPAAPAGPVDVGDAVAPGLGAAVGVAPCPPAAAGPPAEAGCAEGTAQTVGEAASGPSPATPGLG